MEIRKLKAKYRSRLEYEHIQSYTWASSNDGVSVLTDVDCTTVTSETTALREEVSGDEEYGIVTEGRWKSLVHQRRELCDEIYTLYTGIALESFM